MRLRIQVVTEPRPNWHLSYFVRHLADLWRIDGHDVVVGPADRLQADIGLLHVDRTWVPRGFLPANPDGCPLLNERVLDISKRGFSDLVVGPDTDYDGPVMIKTDANFYGIPERKLQNWRHLRKLRRQWAKAETWRWMRELPGTYPVIEHRRDVPGWVWHRDDLVVERFVPERDGDLYVLRTWRFLGDREYGVKMWSRDPVVKNRNMIRFEFHHDIPKELRAVRRRLGFDFGKFDYVMVGGEPALLDVNKTPTVASSSRDPSAELVRLAGGLYSYLEAEAP